MNNENRPLVDLSQIGALDPFAIRLAPRITNSSTTPDLDAILAISPEYTTPPKDGISFLFVQLMKGTRKVSRETSRKMIQRSIGQSTHDPEEFLDMFNLSFKIMASFRTPALAKHLTLDQESWFGYESNSRAKQFLKDLSEAHSTEGTVFTFDLGKKALYEKLFTAYAYLHHADTLPAFAQDLNSLPVGFAGVKYGITVSLPEQGGIRSFIAPPEITAGERVKLLKLVEKNPTDITQEDFELALKASYCFHRSVQQLANTVLIHALDSSSTDSTKKTLSKINGALNSRSNATVNYTRQILSSVRISETMLPAEFAKLEVYKSIQSELNKYLKREEYDHALIEEVDQLIVKLDSLGAIRHFADSLSADQDVLYETLRGTSLQAIIPRNLHFMELLENAQVENPALDILAREVSKSFGNIITLPELLALFDPNRPLGFFIDNLNAKWQNLRRVTREQIWPSFITERQAKIWPSDREIDNLRFTSGHPAAVLGFESVKFLTRGYTPPESEVHFTIKGSDSFFRARLTKDGHLVPLTYNINHDVVNQWNIPDNIQAFLEHIAVASFQELVTIAENRLLEAGTQKKSPARRHENATTAENSQGPLLPRRETTYLRFSTGYEVRDLDIEDVIDSAMQRSRQPRPIAQRVVPLPYAARYRYFLEQAELATKNGEPFEKVKYWQGMAAETRAQIKKPSTSKLDKLPAEYKLETTPDGVFLETWRVAHLRPKPKNGEEIDLITLYERHYRAAPIGFTSHLSTWFTQAVA